ncbi:MAG: potassium-transporting ATPase subunit C [Thermoplasmata archaeon]|jgi:K+-transporting ATPase ATPase C chain|nr:potassium-transporting ATPase subunit C [Thermoplasmata archaeon]
MSGTPATPSEALPETPPEIPLPIPAPGSEGGPTPLNPPVVSTAAPPSTGAVGRRRVPRAHSLATHLRATALLLVLTLLVSGFAYPAFVTAVAQVLEPETANGSLLHYPNGTVAGSALIAQNTSAPYLFWSRPSLTDYNTTLGADTPPGPTDPALAQLLNETLNYTREYGNFTVNASIPFWFVGPSASSIDPDLTPESILVQIPRVSEASNLSISFLTSFVNAHIQTSILPYVGVAYVDVLRLDLALLPLEGR